MSHPRPRSAPILLHTSALLGICALVTALLAISATGPRARAAQDQGGSAQTFPVRDFDGKPTNAKVRVSQTKDLRNQVVRISYSGLRPTFQSDFGGTPRVDPATGEPTGPLSQLNDSSTVGRLVVLQCWSSDPTRERCLTTSRDGSLTQRFDRSRPWKSMCPGDPLPYECDLFGSYFDAAEKDPAAGASDPVKTGKPQDNEIPFINSKNKKYAHGSDIPDTTNSADASVSGVISPDGTGFVDFELRTFREAPSLDCSRDTHCSLVLVPTDRPIPAFSPSGISAEDRAYVQRDAMGAVGKFSASNWARRVIVPLEFAEPGITETWNDANGDGKRDDGEVTYSAAGCKLGGDDQLNTYGDEQTRDLIGRWQPALCVRGTDPVTVSHSTLGDLQVADQFALRRTPIAFVEDPPVATAASRPRRYAAVSASGFGVGWVHDGASDGTVVRMTPRLVAKLLTESYGATSVGQVPDLNLTKPFASIGEDPEFLALNAKTKIGSGHPVVFTRNADAVRHLWQWVLADPVASAWIKGTPDPKGMRVNKAWVGYTGEDHFTTRDSWVCPSNLCGSLWWYEGPPLVNDPYALHYFAGVDSLEAVAQRLVRGVHPDTSWWSSAKQRWAAPDTAPIGRRTDIGLLDSPTAARLGISMAALQNSSGNFVQPDTASIAAAVSHAVRDEVTGAWSIDRSVKDADAYPVTIIAHAMVATGDLDAPTATKVAAILDHAASAGQVPGGQNGGLPDGYVPLTAGMKAATKETADLVTRQVDVPTATATPTPTLTPTATATATATPSPSPSPTAAARPVPSASPPTAATAASTARATSPSPTVLPGSSVGTTIWPSPTPTVASTPKPTTSPSANSTASPTPTRKPEGVRARPSTRPAAGASPSVAPTASPSTTALETASPGAAAPVASVAAAFEPVASRTDAAGPLRWLLFVALLLGSLGALSGPLLRAHGEGRPLASTLSGVRRIGRRRRP